MSAQIIYMGFHLVLNGGRTMGASLHRGASRSGGLSDWRYVKSRTEDLDYKVV